MKPVIFKLNINIKISYKEKITKNNFSFESPYDCQCWYSTFAKYQFKFLKKKKKKKSNYSNYLTVNAHAVDNRNIFHANLNCRKFYKLYRRST